MIGKIKKDIKRIKLETDRCVKEGGLESSVSLRITSKNEIKRYANLHAEQKAQNLPPWSTIQVLDGVAVLAYLDAEKRDGPIQIRLLGEVPSDLIVHISEHYQEVNEVNATWTFKHPSLQCFTIYPKDMRILSPREDSNTKNYFQRLYFSFDT